MTIRTAPSVADLLADPATAPMPARTLTADRQHLAYGPLGIALLHIERAAAGLGPWQRAHDWMAVATVQPFTAGPDSHPFYGAPALAHVVACAADHQPGRYQPTLAALDAQITRDARHRLDAAHRRIDAGELPRLSEFDTIRGLTGYGAYLLHRDPSAPIVRDVLEYLVRLVDPVHVEGERLPGWWTSDGPSGRRDPLFPRGHANSGLAHGIGGVLAFLALAARRGTVVHGHLDAIRSILTWLDSWREAGSPGISWPYWVTLRELRARRLAPTAARRPSWCYGTAGLARARQLAAIALGDQALQVEAEITLLAAFTDLPQMQATTDDGLCHGFAGLAHIATRAAEDADPATASRLRAAIPALLDQIGPPDLASPGFLDGAAGVALAQSDSTPISRWDACLLIA
ncbi:lanthionine synthetase C family protein [Streptomyces sp. NBC_01198]|uniref:lanthionine synthetase C family protein n=1 Tax=Streptomyces sp. NBC_01198 TaxID=2903769 RepID=UPI002E149015|nr:lanthionine synthetase C family protein [Streptomyces sp. NBC_01198]